jgi:putative redox protein
MAPARVDVTWQQEDRHNSIFLRRIALDPDLSEDQQARLIEIADKCPVHRMLEGEITVKTERVE